MRFQRQAWVLGTACNIMVALAESTTGFKRNVDSLNQLIGSARLSKPLAKDLRRYLYSSEDIINSRQSTVLEYINACTIQGESGIYTVLSGNCSRFSSQGFSLRGSWVG